MIGVKALTFDVFGTVVDWRGTIIREGEAFNRTHGCAVDWAGLADAWRAQYQPMLSRVRTGELPWTKLDALHRMALDTLLPDYGLGDLAESDRVRLNEVWHRLDPWPDVVAGLHRLRTRHILATLSNGNVRLLVDMAKRAGLPWDAILGPELAQAYKPLPAAYLTAPQFLDLAPAECMMVAAHYSDLTAAAVCGFRTCYVHRPLEHGSSAQPDLPADHTLDLVVDDFHALADRLGCPEHPQRSR